MVEEFSLGQRESEILVDSLEEVSSAKTKQCTGRISKKDLGWEREEVWVEARAEDGGRAE